MTPERAQTARGSETRCEAVVWKRDTYRRTGRGKSGLELHYTRERCRRRAAANGRCWQHKEPR